MGRKQKNWYLRKPDGSEYGPVTTVELLRWAAQCRIAPGNGISEDHETWQKVEDIPELEMDWMAHRPDGKAYGPFNIAATQELFDHDVLPEDAVLTHRTTGEHMTVTEALGDRAARDTKTSETPHKVAAASDDAPPAHTDAVPEGEASSAPEPDHAETPVAAPDADAAAQAVPTTDDDAERDALQHKISALKTKLKSTQKEIRNLRNALDKADNDKTEALAAMKAERDNAHDNAATLQAAIETLRQDHKTALKTRDHDIAELKTALDDAKKTQKQAKTSLSRLKNEHADSEKQVVKSTAELRKQTAFMKKNNATLQSELNAMERKAAMRGRWLAALLLILAASGSGFILLGPPSCQRTPAGPSAPDTQAQEKPDAPPSRQDTARISANTAADSRSATAETPAAPPLWPALPVAGVNVSTSPTLCTLRFEEGVFTRMTTPSKTAIKQLTAIAGKLRPHMDYFQLIVEGHTDDQPLKTTTTYDGNYALGLARAETVRTFLITKAKLPGYAVRAASDGERNPPYPNTSRANRKRNRTVVLKLVRH